MNDPYRYFVSDIPRRTIAIDLYESVASLPLICPHSHVDPRLFTEPDTHFGNPVELLIQPDHYILRVLHSQGISYAQLGIPARVSGKVEMDPRKIWQLFADNFYLFDATPSGLWLRDELQGVFGVEEKLNSTNAEKIYDQINNCLTDRQFTPRALYKRFNIQVLCTTDSAEDSLSAHEQLHNSDWQGVILPTFRPDNIVQIDQPNWLEAITRLSQTSGIEVKDFASYIHAIENRRAFFITLGATATDQGVESAETTMLTPNEVEAIFQRGLKQECSEQDERRFVAHMLNEMARMSCEDGLVMQLHAGCLRNHDQELFENYGAELSADFPVSCEFTRSLRPLLNRFGNNPKFSLILFTLDESTYTRELAPLASYYPALKLGPPWWFHDSINGMNRYFDQVMESGGIYNTVGFNDDTRAFLSIPARHDLWRRISANWLAGLVSRQIISHEDAQIMMTELAYGLVKKAYHFQK